MPTMHTIEEHEAQQVKPYIDASIQNLSNQANYNTENGVKNILPITLKSKTANKIAITVNVDGTITVNSVGGEASSGLVAETIGSFTGVTNIKLSGCPSGGNSSTYCLQLKQGSSYPVTETGSGATYTCDPSLTYEVMLVIRSGQTISNKVFKPMVTLGFVPNSDYAHFQPYTLSNSALTTQANYNTKNGVKNVIPFPYKTVNGHVNHSITYTYTGNGVIVANGTADAASTFYIFQDVPASELQWLNGMVLSGMTDGDGNNFIGVNMHVSPWTNYGRCTTTGVVISGIPNDSSITVDCILRIGSGKVLSNKKFYPMICSKALYDADPTWQPPSRSNPVLTQETTGLIENTKANGCVNYAPNNGTTQTASDGTTTFTWTVNADKTVTLSAPSYPVTLQANIASLHTWDLTTAECTPLVGKVVKLTGCPSGGNNKLRAMVYRVLSANGSSGSVEDYGDGIVFTWLNNGSGTRPYIALSALSGYVMTGPVIFKPMISLASMNLSYGDYVPFAKTNRELTEDVAKLTIKTATFSANTGTNGIVASGIPEAKAPKCIPISVSFTSTAPPPCAGFEYNNSYGAWYIRCKNWDGSLRLNADVAGTIRYIDLN